MAPGVTYRRVFSGSACALAYACSAVMFTHLHHPIIVTSTDNGSHVALWLAALAASGALGLAINNVLIIVALRLSDPAMGIRTQLIERDALVTDLCQLTLAILIALPTAFSPFLLVVALPVVVVMRRFMMHAQLLTAARIDAKTGLLNAATWHGEAELEVSRAVRIGSPLAIMIADIDHFKAVNDSHGHLVGDTTLSLLSATMSALLRDYDLLGRFGGEEFAICLPHTSPEEAVLTADRIREKISEMGAGGAGALPVHITISVGVASLERVSRTLDEMLAAADAALYQAKSAGRNCVMLSREERLRSTG
jgi:diguanylate cyclase (GGDEF)-like protein